MVASARLLDTRAPRDPAAAVLVLHGGASRPDRPEVSPAQLSVLRMVPVASRLARAGRGRLAVHRLLNTHRGWDSTHTPVDDVRWALGRVRERYGDLPVALVGHDPHLSALASLLVTGKVEPVRFRLRKCAVLRLERSSGGWIVQWQVSPDLL